VFLNTCAIREKAEQKVWDRLYSLRAEKRKKKRDITVGVLGCMAERLKTKLLEGDKLVDVVVGPDAYRDLPRLIAKVDNESQPAINVILSQDETYAGR
jgi:tRNA-2-methylthio-N6-dimethylallyladenosine synthase